MDPDTKKDALEQAGALAGATLVSSQLGAAAVPAAVVAAVNVWYKLQSWRVKRWWDQFVARDDAELEDFETDVDVAITNGDDHVVNAILSGAKAAAEAADPVVIPALGRLARRFLRAKGSMPSWLFRSSLELLKGLDGKEFTALGALLTAISKKAGEQPELVKDGRIRLCADKKEPWTVYAIRSRQRHPFFAQEGYRRLFRALKANDLGDELAEPPSDVAAVDAVGLDMTHVRELLAVVSPGGGQ